jgi:hypothetical protein
MVADVEYAALARAATPRDDGKDGGRVSVRVDKCKSRHVY